MPVEIGDFRPAQFHRHTEQVRVTAAGEPRVGVVVDHVAGLAPEHDHRQRRGQHQLHGAAQAGRPGFKRAQVGLAPVKGADASGHLALPTVTPVAIG